MKKLMVTMISFSAVLGGMALAVTASANHGAGSTTLNGGKDSGKTELGVEKGDGGHFEMNTAEKGDAGHFAVDAIEKGDAGHVSTLAHGKDGG